MITFKLGGSKKDTYNMTDEELVNELMDALSRPIKRGKRKRGKRSR